MEIFVRLRLEELLENRGVTQAELGRRTGLTEDRVSKLVRNLWKKISKEEVGVLLHALDATVAELFEVYQPTVFFGARWNGPLKIHVASRSPIRNGPPHPDYHLLPLTFNARDLQAFKLVHDYTRKLGIEAQIELHIPRSMNDAPFEDPMESGNHVIIGSNRTGQLTEYVLARMYDAPPFDQYFLDRFPFNFSWGAHRILPSSFGFDARERGLAEGIYSVRQKEIVAKRTRETEGAGLDCGLIAVYRVESPPEDDLRGIRRERCVIVLAGHGRYGTLGCARLLVDPQYQERLYPEEAELPKMFAVQVRHFREPSLETDVGDGDSVVTGVEIVAQA